MDQRTLVVGILNVTPDSFSDGGLHAGREKALEHALRMVDEGADVIDVGGESTRPGAQLVSEQAELERVLPVIEALSGRVSVPISIDTSKARVAAAALDAGADIVNDVSALRADPRMASLVARRGVPVVLMHMLGEPKTMQIFPSYQDVVAEVSGFLCERVRIAERAGIDRSKIIVDPGIGFGKNLSHNLQLLNGLERLTPIGAAVMVGPSRKSFVGAILGTEAGDRLEGTLAAVAHAVVQGVGFVRVHDVRQVKRTVRVIEAILEAGGK